MTRQWWVYEDRAAYERYVAWCKSIGVEPAGVMAWHKGRRLKPHGPTLYRDGEEGWDEIPVVCRGSVVPLEPAPSFDSGMKTIKEFKESKNQTSRELARASEVASA